MRTEKDCLTLTSGLVTNSFTEPALLCLFGMLCLEYQKYPQAMFWDNYPEVPGEAPNNSLGKEDYPMTEPLKDPRITQLRNLIGNVHALSETAQDIDDCINNAVAYQQIIESHFKAVLTRLTGVPCIGLCCNCAWPLYRRADGDVRHYEISYDLGNRCSIPRTEGNGVYGT